MFKLSYSSKGFFLHILILFRLQALYLLLLIHQTEFMVLMQSHHFQKQQDKLLNCLLKLTIPLPGHISFNKVSNVTNLKILELLNYMYKRFVIF